MNKVRVRVRVRVKHEEAAPSSGQSTQNKYNMHVIFRHPCVCSSCEALEVTRVYRQRHHAPSNRLLLPLLLYVAALVTNTIPQHLLEPFIALQLHSNAMLAIVNSPAQSATTI